MLTLGLDDTDVLDTPGTNQLARHLVKELATDWQGRLITRHQLSEDPRVPCTRRNGCVALRLESRGTQSVAELTERIRAIMLAWCPVGSDPGLCITTEEVPLAIQEFGRRCQSDVVTQDEARQLAAAHDIPLYGLGGNNDGIIGALAAVGLQQTRNDGRVIWIGNTETDHYDISGVQEISDLVRFGIDEVQRLGSFESVLDGRVQVGKRLRPNYRAGKIRLYVTPMSEQPEPEAGVEWYAERLT
jgi:tRNA(Ile2) C34 agmatinyltransferase TiaS